MVDYMPRNIARSFILIILLVMLATGVTYAALQSPQIKLTGSTISTATANLLISSDGVNYATSKPGFDFNNLVPGGGPSPWDGYSLWLKNSGGISENLKISVSSLPTNPDHVDLTKVNVILTPVGFNAGPSQTYTLDALINSNASGGLTITSPTQLFAGNVQQFTIKVSMATDAVTSPSASIGNVDFSFIGQAVTN